MKHALLPIVALLLLSFSSAAQSKNRKANKAYQDAMLQLRDGFIPDAIPLLGKAIEYDPQFLDAYLSLAGVYGELKNYSKSIEYYEKVKAKDESYFAPFLLSYSINLAGDGRFREALSAVDKFLQDPHLSDRSRKSATYRKNCYQFAVDGESANDTAYVFLPVNLGDSVNSIHSEYYPSITINDSILVFTRKINSREDFFQSKIDGEKFGKAAAIEGSINAESFKGALHISQDGEWLIFAGDFGARGFGNYDLYISYNTPQGWSEPINLGENINTEHWETAPTLSADKTALYFVSSRPGGYGGSDLYVSYRQPNGKFGKAVNMGPAINTKGDEHAPFIHPDNNSFYFSSNGHPGYGGSDLFIMRRKSNDEWSTPENLGYPINTIENEGSIFIASNGMDAYYASDRADSRGGLDLYRFQLREDIRPAKTLYVQGYILNRVTQKGIPASVELIDNETQQTVNRIQSDETGFYFITLPVGKDYTFSVNRKGFMFYTEVYPLKEEKAFTTFNKNILLEPVEVNQKLRFKNVHFKSNTAELEAISFVELEELFLFLKNNDRVKVEISGHTDATGNEGLNKLLSQQRADAVAGYLIKKGIDKSRLIVRGYGATQPVADNETEYGKAKNRRTEMTIIAIE